MLFEDDTPRVHACWVSSSFYVQLFLHPSTIPFKRDFQPEKTRVPFPGDEGLENLWNRKDIPMKRTLNTIWRDIHLPNNSFSKFSHLKKIVANAKEKKAFSPIYMDLPIAYAKSCKWYRVTLGCSTLIKHKVYVFFSISKVK